MKANSKIEDEIHAFATWRSHFFKSKSKQTMSELTKAELLEAVELIKTEIVIQKLKGNGCRPHMLWLSILDNAIQLRKA